MQILSEIETMLEDRKNSLLFFPSKYTKSSVAVSHKIIGTEDKFCGGTAGLTKISSVTNASS